MDPNARAKRITRSRFLLALAAPAALLADPAKHDGRLSAAEINEIVDLLRQSQSDTMTKIAALDDAQWSFKSAPDRWSAGQVLEHLFLSEAGFVSRVDSLMSAESNPDWAKLSSGKSELITRVLPDRTNRAQAPPPFIPKGEMSRAKLVGAYSAQRSRMIELAGDGSKPYKAHIDESGTPLGPLSAAHWLRFAALHNVRHNKQIDEVLAGPKFPG